MICRNPLLIKIKNNNNNKPCKFSINNNSMYKSNKYNNNSNHKLFSLQLTN